MVAPLHLTPGETNLQLVDRVLQLNRESASLDSYRERARSGHGDWELSSDGKFLFQGRLVVPDEDDLRARLLDDVHRQVLTAHPGKDKTKRLLKRQYYWPSWNKDVDRYVDNCMVCKRTKTRKDLPPGLLNPLPIPDCPWQHIGIDFRSFHITLDCVTRLSGVRSRRAVHFGVLDRAL